MKTQFRKTTAWLLALAMLITMFPGFTLTASAADTDADKAIAYGTSVIADGDKANNKWDYVYYGTYDNNPIKWRVLSKNGNGGTYTDNDGNAVTAPIFLLSEYVLKNIQFENSQQNDGDGQSKPNDWQKSNAQAWCRNDFAGNSFSDAEKKYVLKTTKTDAAETLFNTSWGTSELKDDTAFFISAKEASDYLGSNAYDEGLIASADWWLRSPFSLYSSAASYVLSNGAVSAPTVTQALGARPAFNLNPSSVLFTSAAEGGKPEAFGEVAAYSGSEWKLTLKDDSRSSFSFSVESAVRTSTKVYSVTLSYSDAAVGANEYISAMIRDADGNVTYYGRLKNVADIAEVSGTVEIDLSGVTMNATDTLYIFNEQYNGDYKTDYASELEAVTIPSEINAYDVIFDANGGECAPASWHTLDGKLTSLPEATNTCYELLGWYDAKTGGTKITTDTVFTADTTVYAQWKPVYWTDEGNYDISWYDANEYSYYINDGADLAGLAVLVNGMNGETVTSFAGKTIILNNDIDLSTYMWTPIGSFDVRFDGTFNGNKKTITGMNVNEINTDPEVAIDGVGLFGYFDGTSGGMIRDLTVTDSSVVSEGNNGYHTGGIVGFLYRTTLLNCSYSGSVTGSYIVGGLVGSAAYSNVTKCTNYAKVTSTTTFADGKAGGIVGDNVGYISQCSNFGDITGSSYVGGIAGYMSGSSSIYIKNSYNIGTVSAKGSNYAGGIVAYEYSCTVSNCYYLDTSCTAGIGSGSETAIAGTIAKDSNAFSSGEVAWLLNDSADGGSTWRQNLDNGKTTDDYPVLLSTHDKVYQIITYAQCDKGDTSPIITYSNNDTSDVVPAHVYQYSATDHVITETCKNCETHTETATIKIDSSAELVYAPDTEHKPAMVEYSDGWLGGTLTVTYENNINAGTDTAKAIIEKGDAKATLAFSIRQATNEWTTAPTISGWTYGGAANAPTYEAKFGNGDVVVTYTGTTSSGEDYAASTTPPTEAGDYTATFTVEETTNYSGLTETKEFTVSTASIEEAMVAVSDVAYTGKEQEPTVTVTLGGKTLTENTDYIVSYSGNTDLGTATVTVTGKGNYTGDATGSFEIDYLVTDAEATVSGTEGANDWYTSMVTLTAPTGYTISKTVDVGYANTISYDAEQNGTVTYYLQNTNGEIAQKTLALKIDLTAPTAQYNIKGNDWREFVSFITFGIFCKDNADLTIQASDTMDSAVTVEYVISKTELNAGDITGWNTYTGKVALNPQAKNYIYIRITDDAGHTVVYESGVVVFTDCTESVSIEYYKDTDGDVAVPIAFNGNTVKEVKYGDNLLTDGQYTRTDSGITFDAEYLDTFAASDTPYTFTVSYHPMGVEMGVDAEGDIPANTTVSLTVKKQSGSVTNISDIGKTYDGTAVSVPDYNSLSTGMATFEYKVKGTDDATYSEIAPKNAGTYVVRVTVAADGNYKEAHATAEFTISKETLTVTAENKTATYGDKAPAYTVIYDGFKGNDTKDSLGGKLVFDCNYAQFEDKGEYTITPKGYKSANYNFNYVGGKLTVSAKPITVTIDAKSSIYGNEIVVLTATDNGIVNNDANVYKLTTTASKTAGVGKYDITGTALDDNYIITFANEDDAYEITTRELTVSVVVADKQYDGRNTASITSAVLNNIANGDEVALVNGTATFESVNAANGIGIAFTDFALSGNTDVLKNYTLIQPTGVKANITNDWTPTEYTVSAPNSNGWLNADFVITANEGYLIATDNKDTSDWTDKLTYSEETDKGEVTFYLRKANGEISLAKTENYKLDKVAPTGKVEFAERKAWQEFVNTITFGLFYNAEVTVKAEAADALSDIASIAYAGSDKAMTLDEVKAVTDWTAMPADGVAVTLEDAKQFIYYIRITDKAGNVTYLSTDGAEYDTTAPVIDGVHNGVTYHTTQKVTVTDRNLDTVTLNGELVIGKNLDTITLNGESVIGKNLDTVTLNSEPVIDKNLDTVTLNSEDVTGTITLEGDKETTYTIVATDKAGNSTTVTVTMKRTESVGAPLDGITEENVTSDDKETIQDVIDQIDALLTDEDLTEDEKDVLEEIREEAEMLIRRIRTVTEATNTENTEKVEDVTAETVTPENKNDLENAKADLEKALEENGGNYTDDEKKAIEDEIKRIDEALTVIENVEAIEDKINKLPENITKENTDDVDAVKKAYDELSDYEKTLIDPVVKAKLDAAVKAAEEANKPAGSNSPATGDTTSLWLWFALLFVSGGAVITLIVYDRKKRSVNSKSS